jgi:hypothetical protein
MLGYGALGQLALGQFPSFVLPPPPPPPPPAFSGGPAISDFILEAYQLIQVRPESLRQEHMVIARTELNLLFSQWSNTQINLWEVVRTQVSLVVGTANYSVPANTILVTDVSIVRNFGASNESRRFIEPISRTLYMSIQNQLTPGVPYLYWYDRLTNPVISLYPVPNSGGLTLDYFAVTQMQDANSLAGEFPDVPYRWYDALIQGLAYRLARVYRPDLEESRKVYADNAWTIAATQDIENVPISLAPSVTSFYRKMGYI